MKQRGFYSSIMYLACTLFTPIALLLNLLCALIVAPEKLAPLYAIYLILIFSLIISCVVLVVKNEPPKFLNQRVFSYFVLLFTLVSVFLNTFVCIFKANFVWNIYSVFLILGFSLALAICIRYVRFKNIGIAFLFYFIL